MELWLWFQVTWTVFFPWNADKNQDSELIPFIVLICEEKWACLSGSREVEDLARFCNTLWQRQSISKNNRSNVEFDILKSVFNYALD